MAATRPRVVISRNAEEALDLAAKIYKKHQLMANTSPLNAMQNHTWAVNGPQVANALSAHQQAEEYKRLAEETYRKRDLLMAEITESIKSSRDILLGVYRDNTKIMGEWGFEVNETPTKKATTKKTV
ncbi:MAG: hypothetical protein WCK02_16980 [Bacteroidota bacterium]